MWNLTTTLAKVHMLSPSSQVDIFSSKSQMIWSGCETPGDILSWSASEWTIENRFPQLVTLQGPFSYLLLINTYNSV
jgi:hypothetical protein